MKLYITFVIFAILLLFVYANDENNDKNENNKKKKDFGPIIGIDLGTTYSCVGIYKDGKVEIIPNDQGNRITPSYVAFTEEGERLVGDAAKNQASINPTNTVFDVKRLIGRRYHDKSVQHDKSLLPFNIIEGNDGSPALSVLVNGKRKTFQPEEISSMILQYMKTQAEQYLGKEIKNAVVTVPAYFNDAQRQATKDAGTIAGLNVMRIINEPTAAAIAYGLEKTSHDKNILVYDLGGGTFDVSILALDEGVFEVLATNGDTHLGGEDFDQRVMDYFLKEIQKKYSKNLRKNLRAMSKLRREVEKAKRALSSVHQTKIEIESLIDGEDFSETLTRAKFEELNIDLFKKTLKPVSKVLKDAGVNKRGIHEVVLVGGSTRIPKIQQLIKDYFKKEPNRGINPDEAVAYGAAVQGGILSGDALSQGGKEILLLDVTPLSLGIELAGGEFAKIIERNTVIPTKKTEIFTTESDNQDTLLTSIYQGERARARHNVLLGEFELTGIPPAPRGVPEIELTFELDANSILSVTARDKKTGKSESMVISSNKGRLSEDQVAAMVEDAEKFAEEDRKFRERVRAREDLEGVVYDVKHQINDEKRLGGRIGEDDKKKIMKWIEQELSFIESNDEAPKSEYLSHKRDFRSKVDPIIERIYAETKGSEEGDSNESDNNFEDPHSHDDL